MSDLTLAQARTIVDTALEKAAELGLRPLGVVVLDAGGHPVALLRQDGSSILRTNVAEGKAYGALAMGHGSRFLDAAAMERPHFVQALSGITDGKMVPVPGGVLIKTQDGRTVGAVGISGDTSDNDEACAIAGIEAAGFTAQVD